jgi:hypothetical protein
MADLQIDKLTLKLSGLNRQDAERLAHRIAKGLAGAKLSGPSRKIGGISSRVTAPTGSGQDALAEAVIADLIRSLERQN